MEETKNDEQSPSECCAGGTGPESCGPDSSLAGCGCATTPTRRPWLKTLIAVIILLAAVGVGAYSMLATSAPEETSAPGSDDSSRRTAPASATAQSVPNAAQPACCGGAVHEAPAPQPACCSGAAHATPSPQSSCCGGETSMAPAMLPGEPKCGAKPKGCCGR